MMVEEALGPLTVCEAHSPLGLESRPRNTVRPSEFHVSSALES